MNIKRKRIERTFNTPLDIPKVGDVITNREVYERFQCPLFGGIRYSKRFNLLVIIKESIWQFIKR